MYMMKVLMLILHHYHVIFPFIFSIVELVWTDGPGFGLCAAPLESSSPGFRGVEQRFGE